jgi:UMF1 family MFS transporter
MAIEAPEGKRAEFFGFMTFSTKMAAIFGPLLYGTISSRTGNPRIALLSLEALFVLGLLVMLRVPEPLRIHRTDKRCAKQSGE